MPFDVACQGFRRGEPGVGGGERIRAVLDPHVAAVVQGAGSQDAAVLPFGFPTFLTHADQRRHLPDGLDVDVVAVSTGADLLEAAGRA